MKTKILNVPIDNVTPKEACDKLINFLKEDKNHIVITPNPEMVMEALKDKDFLNIFDKADLVVPDGIGIVIASKLNKEKIKQRVTGCDLIQSLFENIKNEEKTVYLLGGKPGICEKAKENLETIYMGLKIIGFHDGYFDEKEEKLIIEQIKTLKPDILLVGIGFPKQEKWIYNNQKQLPVKISIGVGGSLDVFAGTVKRAPVLFQEIGLEWFYRLLKQPSRAFRMMQLPLFMVKVICNKIGL